MLMSGWSDAVKSDFDNRLVNESDRRLEPASEPRCHHHPTCHAPHWWAKIDEI